MHGTDIPFVIVFPFIKLQFYSILYTWKTMFFFAGYRLSPVKFNMPAVNPPHTFNGKHILLSLPFPPYLPGTSEYNQIPCNIRCQTLRSVTRDQVIIFNPHARRCPVRRFPAPAYVPHYVPSDTISRRQERVLMNIQTGAVSRSMRQVIPCATYNRFHGKIHVPCADSSLRVLSAASLAAFTVL